MRPLQKNYPGKDVRFSAFFTSFFIFSWQETIKLFQKEAFRVFFYSYFTVFIGLDATIPGDLYKL